MENISKKTKLKKGWSLLGLAIILFFVLRLVLLREPSKDIPYTVVMQDLVESVVVSAVFDIASQVNVSTPATGIVTELWVENGDWVEKGDKLFYVESTATKEETSIAYADYQEAKSAHDQSLNTLRDKEAIADNILDILQGKDDTESFGERATRTTAETARDSANVAVSSTRAKMNAALLAYQATQSTTIFSPARGVVTNLLEQEGDHIQASDKSILVVANFSNPRMNADVSEDYFIRLAVDQSVSIVFDAMRGKTFEGIIDALDSMGTTNSGVVTYGLRIDPKNLPNSIKPGMTAIVTIETHRIDNALSVPKSAIVEKEEVNYVEIFESEKLTEVELGFEGLSATEILSGVEVGTRININPDTSIYDN